MTLYLKCLITWTEQLLYSTTWADNCVVYLSLSGLHKDWLDLIMDVLQSPIGAYNLRFVNKFLVS